MGWEDDMYEARHRQAAIRMAQYDKLPASKRMFIQQNSHLFFNSDMVKHPVSKLIKWRKDQSAKWCHMVYGVDHPYASSEKPKVKRERSSQ